VIDYGAAPREPDLNDGFISQEHQGDAVGNSSNLLDILASDVNRVWNKLT
jgi:hypothetical protein